MENERENEYSFKDALWLQITIIEGNGYINGLESKRYDSFLIAKDEKLKIKGNIKCLVSFITN